MNNAWYDANAEKSVIGSILQDSQCLWALDELVEEDFVIPEYAAAFGAARSLRAEGSPVDLMTIGRKLADKGHQVDPSKLLEAVRFVPSTANLKAYTGIVTEFSRRRAIKQQCEETIRNLENGADDALDEAITNLRGLIGGKSTWMSGAEVAGKAFEMIEAISRGELKSIPTPLPELNEVLAGGLRKGDLTVVAAGTGQGKSALSLEIARNAAKKGFHVGFISREMSAEQYGLRAFSSITGISTGAMLQAKKLVQEQLESLGDALNEIGNLPLDFSFRTETVEDVRRDVQRKKRIDLLIIDYLQILGTKKDYASEHLRVGYITKTLKALAMDMQIPVMLLSQFKRMPMGARPALSDLKESGSIENDADNVWLIHRPDAGSDAIPPQYTGWVEACEDMGDRFLLLDVAKQRMFDPRMIGVGFSPSHMRFYTPKTD